MRKVGLILLMVVFTTMLAATSLFAAGVINSQHDITSIEPAQGACSVCHIPHKSPGGGRLWAGGMGGGLVTVVANLCSSCHRGAAGYGATGLPNARAAISTVYGGNAAGNSGMSHGYEVNNYVTSNVFSQPLADDELSASGLPYTGGANPYDVSEPVASIECTSCHNVHDDATYKPFLRVNIRDLCIRCHKHRYNPTGGVLVTDWQQGGVLGNWPVAGLGTGNPGSHPVGVNVATDFNIGGADSPIQAWTNVPFDGVLSGSEGAATLMQLFESTDLVARDVTVAGTIGGLWNLGLHVVAAGTNGAGTPGTGAALADGVVCISCHAVHGVQSDNEPTLTPQVAPNTNLLARAQGTAGRVGDGMTGLASVANGQGNDRNNLCEICHFGGAGGVGNFGDALFMMNNGPAGTTYGARPNRPNPGFTVFTHPIDDALVVNEAVAEAAVPINWPIGSNPGATPIVAGAPDIGNPRPICESCHVPHPARAVVKERPDVNYAALAEKGEYILRDNVDDICNQCHSANVSNHHPISTARQMGTAGAVGAFVVPGNGGQIGDGDNWLECNDCHNMSGAHNWTGPNAVGLDPNWEPLDNGRSDGTDVVGGQNANMSETCEECHYRLDTAAGGGAQDSTIAKTPTHLTAALDWVAADIGTGADGRGASGANISYQKHGLSTHFLGDVNPAGGRGEIITWANGWVGATNVPAAGALFDATAAVWPNGNLTPGYSRWGVVGGVSNSVPPRHLVCESCHELEPDRNEPGSKLLLYWFKEGTDSDGTPAGGGVAGKNGATSFFCEGCHSQNGPAATHAMSADTVTRTGLALNSSSNYLDMQDLGDGVIPVAAPRLSGGVVGTIGTSTVDVGMANGMNCDSCHQTHDAPTNSGSYILEAPSANVGDPAPVEFDGRGGDAAANVAGGHPYGNNDADYTNFCDQCHRYTKASINGE